MPKTSKVLMSDLFYSLRLDTSCYSGSTVLFRGSAFDVNLGTSDWIRPAIFAAGSVHPVPFLCLSFPLSRLFYSFLATTPTVMVFFQTWPGVSRGEKGVRSHLFSPFFFSSNHSFHHVRRVCIDVGNGCSEQHAGYVIWSWIFVHRCTGFAKFRGFMWSNILDDNTNILVDKIEMCWFVLINLEGDY